SWSVDALLESPCEGEPRATGAEDDRVPGAGEVVLRKELLERQTHGQGIFGVTTQLPSLAERDARDLPACASEVVQVVEERVRGLEENHLVGGHQGPAHLGVIAETCHGLSILRS